MYIRYISISVQLLLLILLLCTSASAGDVNQCQLMYVRTEPWPYCCNWQRRTAYSKKVVGGILPPQPTNITNYSYYQ